MGSATDRDIDRAIDANVDLTFDAYAEAVREATVNFLKTGPSATIWNVDWYLLDRMVIQYGMDGGAHVVHGITRPDATIMLLQNKRVSGDIFFDGHKVAFTDTVVIGPGRHFTFVSLGNTSWFSLSIPTPVRETLLAFPLPASDKGLFSLPEATAEHLVEVTNSARGALSRGQACDRAAIERTLADALAGAFQHPATTARDFGKRRLSIGETMTEALEYIRAKGSDPITVGDLARDLDVSERTLLRAFREYLQLSPKQYLKYRQLNIARRALRQCAQPGQQVTKILSENGISEFGRFAAEYKRLFAELPSETLLRLAGVAS
jgi:AraC-like DNA-binding protein